MIFCLHKKRKLTSLKIANVLTTLAGNSGLKKLLCLDHNFCEVNSCSMLKDVITDSEKTNFCSIKMYCLFFAFLLSLSLLLIYSLPSFDISFSNLICLATFSFTKTSWLIFAICKSLNGGRYLSYFLQTN